MVRHRAFLPGLVALVVALVFTAPRDEPLRRDREAEAKLRQVWSRERKKPWTDATRRALRDRATEIGEPAARALFQILKEHYTNADWDQWSYVDTDDECEPEGILIGELANEETARALARALADGGLPFGVRRALVIALCRPRLAFTADALVEVACDRRKDPRVRRAVLLRFHRFGCAPSAAIRDLLYQPYDGLDVVAAATLAMCAEPAAPSLVLEGLACKDGQTRYRCAEAACRIIGRSFKLPRASGNQSVTRLPDGSNFGFSNTSIADQHLYAPVVLELEEWIANHDDAGFERERREYLASDRRRREMALRSFEEIAKAEDFDLAAASMWLTSESEDDVGVALERLHRLCSLCERRLRSASGVEERIAALNGLLASLGHETYEHASHLPLLLAEDNGNCLARTTLYLAVAQRLGLPLQAHDLPLHVYVAWEEGGRRRNIETTDAGKERPDGGRVLSARQLLSIHVSNLASARIAAEAYAEAVSLADRALALDPTNPNAYSARAEAAWHADLATDPRPDLDRAEELEPGYAWHWSFSSETACRLGFAKDALRRAETAVRIEASGRAFVAEARACIAAGEPVRARAVAEEAARRWPNADEVRRLLFEISLDREGYAPLDRTDIPALWKARALVDRASPARALACLDAERDGILNGTDARMFDGSTMHIPPNKRLRREFRLLEARALSALGREEEAREALRDAEETAPPNRETLEVRRFLAAK